MTRLALAALVVCAWHAALRVHGLALPLISDEGEYAYAARVWSEGGLPYRDAFCQKPPMTIALYRACLPFSADPRAPRALALLLTLAACGLLAACVPGAWGAPARLAAAGGYAALSTLPVGDYGFAANTEVFLSFFTALAAWCVARSWRSRAPWWALGCGLACGAALMTKQTALLTAAAFALLCAWRAPRRLAAFASGAAVVPGAFVLYFWSRGGLSFLMSDALRGNLSYASVIGPAQYAEQLRWALLWLGPKLLRGAWPALLLAGWGLSGVRAVWAERERVLAVLWLGAGLGGVLTGLFLFPHYFLQAAPALALCAAAGVARLRGRAAWAAAAGAALLPAFSYAGTYASRPGPELARALLFPNPLYEDVELGRLARETTAPSDTLYVFGSEPPIYVYAGRRCATRRTFVYGLTLLRPERGAVDAELAALRAARPRLVVYSTQALSTLIAHSEGLRFRDGVRDWLARDYRWSAQVVVGGPLEAAPKGPPPWDAGDRLLVFYTRDR